MTSVPQSAQFGIGTTSYGSGLPVTIQDGAGKAVVIGHVDPVSHAYVPIGAFPSVLSYGADPTGVRDSAPAFAAAAAAHPGDVIDVPAGTYLWGTAQTFTTPCLFVGRGWNERIAEGGAAPNRTGTWILIKDPTIRPITLAFRGRGGFERMAFEQAHPAPASGWAPTAYLPVVTLAPAGSGEVNLSDLYAWGIYDFVGQDAASQTVGHLFLDRIRGQVFHSVVNILTSLDVIHADDWHVWPYWSQQNDVLNWCQANGNAIVVARCDGWQSSRLFLLGFNSGVTLGNKTSGLNQGPTQNFHVGDLYVDQCKYGVRVTGNNVTAHFGKLTHTGGYASATPGFYPGSMAYLDTAAGTNVAIDRLVSQGCGSSAVSLAGSGSQNVHIGSAFVGTANADNNGSAVFSITSTGGLSSIRFGDAPDLVGSYNGAATASATPGNVITHVWQSWSPTLFGDNAPGTPTYGNRSGRFVIIGNAITVQGLVGATLAGATGNLRIGGLPFPNKTGAQAWGALGYVSGLALDAGYTVASFVMNAGESTLLMLENGPGKGTGIVPAANGNGANLGFSLTYQAF